MSSLSICKFCQILETLIWASQSCFVPLLVAGVKLVLLQILDSSLRISVVISGSVGVIYSVAFEPFLESHRTDDVLIRHRVEGVECLLHSFFSSQTNLEIVWSASISHAFVVIDISVLETPGLENWRVSVFRLHEQIFFLFSVEEKHLNSFVCTLLTSLYQSLSWYFSHTASVRNLKSLLYYEKSLPECLCVYPRCWSRSLMGIWLWCR